MSDVSYQEFLGSKSDLAKKRVKLTEVTGYRVRLVPDRSGEKPLEPFLPQRDRTGRMLMDRIIQDVVVEGADLTWAARRAARWIKGQYKPGRTPPAHIRKHIAAWSAADRPGFREAIDARHDALKIERVKWEDQANAG